MNYFGMQQNDRSSCFTWLSQTRTSRALAELWSTPAVPGVPTNDVLYSLCAMWDRRPQGAPGSSLISCKKSCSLWKQAQSALNNWTLLWAKTIKPCFQPSFLPLSHHFRLHKHKAMGWFAVNMLPAPAFFHISVHPSFSPDLISAQGRMITVTVASLAWTRYN